MGLFEDSWLESGFGRKEDETDTVQYTAKIKEPHQFIPRVKIQLSLRAPPA